MGVKRFGADVKIGEENRTVSPYRRVQKRVQDAERNRCYSNTESVYQFYGAAQYRAEALSRISLCGGNKLAGGLFPRIMRFYVGKTRIGRAVLHGFLCCP